ncbi:hypothetical protein Bhyg_14656 [Pseudolycoriella hygida]|uniref:Uncharacterized protein n=1 Tax=Pseudolycoriella hygida TaxID=35572 RepID=A0A9Q0MR18_9DIPT|nr:hypothetical protein Bhyg_14656 [Pseudolycoriella hygida]
MPQLNPIASRFPAVQGNTQFNLDTQQYPHAVCFFNVINTENSSRAPTFFVNTQAKKYRSAFTQYMVL